MPHAIAFRTSLPLAGAALLACVIGALAALAPTTAVGVTLGLVLLLVTAVRPVAGLALFTYLAILETTPLLLSGVTAAKLLGVLLFAVWLGAVAVNSAGLRHLAVERPAVLAVLLLFGVWTTVSVVHASEPAASGPPLMRLWMDIALVLVAYAFLTDARAKLTVFKGWALGTVTAVIAGLLFGPSLSATEGRFVAVGTDPNEFATLSVASIAFCVGLAITRGRASVERALWSLFAVIACLAVFLTGSRGGLVALAAAAVAAVAVAQRRRGRALAAVIALCGLAVAYFSAIAPPEVRARIINPGSGTGRTDLWTVATRMIEANPLLGVGVGNFPEEAGRYLLVPGLLRETQFIVVDPKVAHNAYLEVAAETGLPGLALFVALLGTAFASCRRAWLRAEAIGDRHLSVAARALFVALVAYAVAIVWLSQQYGKQLWLLLALAFALPDLAAAPDRQRALSPQASQRRRRWTAPRARRRAATATTS